MDRETWLAALEREGTALGEAAGRAGLDARVPSCPKWTVSDLVGHVGSVHRWVAGLVVRGNDSTPEPFRPLDPGPDPLRWFTDGLAAVVRTLSDLEPGLPAWNFSPPAPKVALFWSRRSAHETAVHRWDAELAAGEHTAVAGDGSPSARASAPASVPGPGRTPRPPFPPSFAADGVAEVLDSLLARRAHTEPLASARGRVRVTCTDTGDAWLVALAGGQVGVRADDGTGREPDAAIGGPACDVYLRMWGRVPLDRLDVSGDRNLAEVVRTR